MLRFLSVLTVCLLVLSGCATTNKTSFKNMTAAYRDVVEAYANENILLNVIRASQRMPLSFLDIPSVIGSGSFSASAAINTNIYNDPTSIAGWFSASDVTGSSYSAATAGVSVNNGFTFTQASLDNAAFMKTFLSDITPEVVASLSNNSMIPRPAMYTLMMESIEFHSSDGKVISNISNNPFDGQYEKFQKALYALLGAGLDTEPSFLRVPVTPPFDPKAMGINMGQLAVALAAGISIVELPGVPGKPVMLQMIKATPAFRICMRQNDSEAVLGVGRIDPAFYCKNNSVAGSFPSLKSWSVDALGLAQYKNVKPVIQFRSTSNVFNFLGGLVYLQSKETDPFILTVRDTDKAIRRGEMDFDSLRQTPLFVVDKNVAPERISASIAYRGDDYYVSNSSNTWSSSVIVWLSQLLTLNKILGSVPPSPAVLVK